MATYKRIVKSFNADYHSDIVTMIRSLCDNYSEYRVVSCNIATEKHGYSTTYVAIVVLEKEV